MTEPPAIDHRQAARSVALGRAAIGVVGVVAPTVLGRAWIGDDGAGAARVLMRTTAVRDLALGVGTFRALDAGQPVATWVRLGALCDAVDLAASVLAIRQIGLRRALPVIAVAGAATAVGLAAAEHVD